MNILVEDRARGVRHEHAARALVVRFGAAFEQPFVAQPVDQASRRGFGHVERFGDRPLGRPGVRGDHRDRGPLRAGHPDHLDPLVEALAQLAGDDRQLERNVALDGSLLFDGTALPPQMRSMMIAGAIPPAAHIVIRP